MKKSHDITQCLCDIRTSIDSIEDYLNEFMGNDRDFKARSNPVSTIWIAFRGAMGGILAMTFYGLSS